MKEIYITFITLLICHFGFAQELPKAINYQGIVHDDLNQLAKDKSISLRFSIRQLGNSEIQYQEIQSTRTSREGIFSVNIGEGDRIIGSFENLDWSAKQKSLQVELDLNGFADYSFSYKEVLNYVPSVLFSASADTVLNQGLKGEQGLAGLAGPKGSKGPQGDQGPRGLNAGEGPPGDPGPPGVQGPPGLQGPPGRTLAPQGEIGPQGLQGEPGLAVGPQGPTGPIGEIGPPGPKGNTGIMGEQGPQGLKGALGITGPSSTEVGPQGPPGPQAPNEIYHGPDGPMGRLGTSCFCREIGSGLSKPVCDVNGDGVYNAADCQGYQGPPGQPGPPGNRGSLLVFDMNSNVPSTSFHNLLYLDDGSNRVDGKPGFRIWDGTEWIDL